MNIFLAMQRGPSPAPFEVNKKTPTKFQWDLAQTLVSHICVQFGVRNGKRECRQRTATHGIGARTLDAMGNEGEVVKLFITPIPLFMGTRALEMEPHWWPVC